MKILAIDTSSASGSIALLDDRRLVAEWTAGEAGVHARWLLKTLDNLLESSGHSINDVDLFAVTTGPGSFTGLRIGISAVKGLAWTLKKKVAGVSTLKALACNLRYSASAVCPILDARKGEVYASIYSFKGDKVEEVMAEEAVSPARLFEVVHTSGLKGVVFLGDGLNAYMDYILNNIKDAHIAPRPLWHIRAANIALLALEDLSRAVTADELKPVYLRKSEVELKEGSWT